MSPANRERQQVNYEISETILYSDSKTNTSNTRTTAVFVAIVAAIVVAVTAPSFVDTAAICARELASAASRNYRRHVRERYELSRKTA